MTKPVYAQLTPVRTRQRWLVIVRMAAAGLLVSSLAGVAAGLLKWLADWNVTWPAAALVLTAGPVLGACVGLLLRRPWASAATAVDAHYGLKDRATTALAFVDQPAATPLKELQVTDALRHLANVDSRSVVPLRAPRALPYALATFALAVGLLAWPIRQPAAVAAPSEPLPEILAEAETVEEQLERLEEAAKALENKELEQLVQELQAKVDEMKQPGVDVREALAKLSEMQAGIQAQQAQFNVAQIDAQMQAIGEALGITEPLKNAGQAMVAGQYDRAAEELEENKDAKLERKEAKALVEQLKKSGKNSDSGNAGQLSKAASQVCEACEGGKSLGDSLKQLASECRSQGRRKKINDLLQNCLSCLSECKGNCQKNSFARGKKPQKSTTPSQNFGMGTSGNLLGDKTNLGARRNMEQLSGTADEGPSEFETSHEVDGREQATRSYRDVYQEYQRMSESVLDSEPIPLGHRQTIRRYFELIRPQGEEQSGAPEQPVVGEPPADAAQ